jgi:transmembrane sensor
MTAPASKSVRRGLSDRRSDTANNEAAEWLVRQNEGFSADEQLQFQAWLVADAGNPQAFVAVEKTWRILEAPRTAGQAAQLDRELASLRKRRYRGLWLAVSGMAAAAIVVGIFVPDVRVAESPVVTVAIRPDRQMLSDGSVVELKAGAEIEVSYSLNRRSVRLVQGEALFSVAKDAARPFVVSAGDVKVRAVGTSFAVSHRPTEVAVLVTQGRVAVERAVLLASPAVISVERTPTYLGAGDQLVVPADSPVTAPLTVTAMTTLQITANLGWRGKRVEFTATTLSEAVSLFNNQNELQLVIANPAIGRMQVTGIFWADDPEGFVRLLEAGMNVRAERDPSRIVLHSRSR